MTKPIDYTKEPLGKKFFEGIPDIDPHTGEDIGEVRGEIPESVPVVACADSLNRDRKDGGTFMPRA